MQRSATLTVLVMCPHHGRNVVAKRNTAIDRLVACEESEGCRAPRGEGPNAVTLTFPHGCPVFPSLAGPKGS